MLKAVAAWRTSAPLRAAGRPLALQVRCMARIWRPHIDDVDRLSRGEGARTKGTGCTVIPHRLNAEEAAKYEAAKKKVRARALRPCHAACAGARPQPQRPRPAGGPQLAGCSAPLAC
jgi:hypothetical protein